QSFHHRPAPKTNPNPKHMRIPSILNLPWVRIRVTLENNTSPTGQGFDHSSSTWPMNSWLVPLFFTWLLRRCVQVKEITVTSGTLAQLKRTDHYRVTQVPNRILQVLSTVLLAAINMVQALIHHSG
ncbi:unnamed protein product, partial [Choristocarpus tenellus]